MNLLISNIQTFTKAYIQFNDQRNVSDQFMINLINNGQDIKIQTDEILAQIEQAHQSRKSKQQNDARYRTINFDQAVSPPRASNALKIAERSHLKMENEKKDQKSQEDVKHLKAKIAAMRARNQNPRR